MLVTFEATNLLRASDSLESLASGSLSKHRDKDSLNSPLYS